MKAQLILATLIAGMACGVAHADLPQKAATRIEFNSLIDNNNQDSTTLQKSMVGMEDKDAPAPADDATVKDQKKVLDLVDVEVGVGQDRPVVVDRRYNSVGEPIVDPSFSNAKVQLVDDQDHGS